MKLSSVATSLIGLATVVIGIALVMTILQQNEQQRQLDQNTESVLIWVRSQENAHEGNCCITMGYDYEVVYIDFKNQVGVLKAKTRDGKTEWSIAHEVHPETLKRWSSQRHFRG